MLRPSLIIPRIRDLCPIFAGRVAAAAGFRLCAEEDTFPAPHAFVIPVPDRGDNLEMLGPLSSIIACRVAVVVAVPNISDEPGSEAGELMIDARDELLRALIGFTPSEGYEPITYAGVNDDLDIRRARGWVQFEFASSTDIAGLAGFQGD